MICCTSHSGSHVRRGVFRVSPLDRRRNSLLLDSVPNITFWTKSASSHKAETRCGYDLDIWTDKWTDASKLPVLPLSEFGRTDIPPIGNVHVQIRGPTFRRAADSSGVTPTTTQDYAEVIFSDLAFFVLALPVRVPAVSRTTWRARPR